MKQFLALLFTVTVLLGLCACGGSSDSPEASPTPTAAPTATPVPTKDPAAVAAEYSRSMKAALEGSERGVLTKSKAVTRWTDDQNNTVYNTDLLPAHRTAQSPDEAKYLVIRTERNEAVARYAGLVDGQHTEFDACVRIVTIEITNTVTGEVLAKNQFRGSEPPRVIADPDDRFGDYPDKYEISAWIADTLDQASAAANAAAAEELQLYLNHLYTKPELLDILTVQEGFSIEEAQSALDSSGVDWAQINIAVAQDLLERFPTLSRAGLIAHLTEYEKLSKPVAATAANAAADWNAQALLAAQYLLNDEDGIGYSPNLLKIWLSWSLEDGGYGFEESQAQYAVDNCNGDWFREAEKNAALQIEYWDESNYGELNRENLIYVLQEWEGFTEEQAIHGAKHAGFQ